MILSAISLGVAEMAFTDHIDFLYKERPYPYQINYDMYLKEFRRMKECYSKEIELTLGAEIGLNSYSNDTVNRLIARYDFDFIIASCHDIKGGDLYYPEYYMGRDKSEVHLKYFKNVLECVKNIENYSVFGHLDYISRYGPYEDKSVDYESLNHVIDDILKATISAGKGLEVNTSGYRYGIGAVYPDPRIIKRYKELGGEFVTLGSDAHRPEDIAMDFDKALAILKSAGFEKAHTYRKRKAVGYDIAD